MKAINFNSRRAQRAGIASTLLQGDFHAVKRRVLAPTCACLREPASSHFRAAEEIPNHVLERDWPHELARVRPTNATKTTIDDANT